MRDDLRSDGTMIRSSHPLAALESYWRDLRGDHGLPARAAVDPARLDSALPHAFILERVAPGIGRIRVAGQMISQICEVEPRGMPLCSLFSAGSRDRLQGYLEQVFALPALVELPLCSARRLIRPRVAGRILLLPLADAQGLVSRAIGAIWLDEATTGALDLPDDGPVRIDNVHDMPQPNGRTAQPIMLTRPQPMILRHIARADTPHRGHLRLVVSND
jgi:hypothetical protein